jgi:GntR family transcriptional regulator
MTTDGTAFPWDLVRLDDSETAPLYLQLAERIAAAITARRLRQGQALPPERSLVERLGLSRTTVRRAVEELAARGLVASQHGSGTFVASRLDQPLARLSSFTDDMHARGRTASCVIVECGVRFPSPDEAMALALSARDKVSFLIRVRLADGEPLALEHATVPARLLPDPAEVGGSLYAALLTRDAAPVRALQRMRAAMASAEDAAHLDIAVGSPVMATIRHGYLADGSAVEFTRSTYRGDRYDFIAEMRRDG